MERKAWLQERRQVAEQRHDTLHAPSYDQQEWATISPTHQRFVADLIDRCPPGGRILDAACGTGKYFGMILDASRQLVGTDQSAGMLAQARAKYPDVVVHKVGLQELSFDAEFDAVMCVDAMENVFPEDWPLVLANFRRALRPRGLLYLTVELPDQQDLDRVYAQAVADGLPVVPGEHTALGGGYHYYPPLDQVAAWLRDAGFQQLTNAYGDEYYHLLVVAGRR
jgi:ubiquinone/menaquinone biosynthesis C-methylase UbiE